MKCWWSSGLRAVRARLAMVRQFLVFRSSWRQDEVPKNLRQLARKVGIADDRALGTRQWIDLVNLARAQPWNLLCNLYNTFSQRGLMD